jgi:hypothetical protein
MSAVDYQAMLMTGRSDPRRCALSPAQQAFLDQTVPRERQIGVNFPYEPNSAPYRPTPLLLASARNGWGYLQSRCPAFAGRYGDRIANIIRHRPLTLILTGSCGLELFNNLRLPDDLAARVYLFAYGPVARRRPSCRHVLVGSPRDRLSRWFFPQPDHWVACSHLDYLANPDVIALWRQFLKHADVPCA